MLIRFVLSLLRGKSLSVRDRNVLLDGIMGELGAIPFRDIVSYNSNGVMCINGNEVDLEKARVLRESARGVLANHAFTLIRESVIYQSFAQAATKSKTSEDLLFGKASIWFGQQEIKLLESLAGNIDVEIS